MLGMNLQVLEFDRAFEALFKKLYDSTEARQSEYGNRYNYATEQIRIYIEGNQKTMWKKFP